VDWETTIGNSALCWCARKKIKEFIINNTALVGLDHILDIIHPDGWIAHFVK
jgi:hypothetical protein